VKIRLILVAGLACLPAVSRAAAPAPVPVVGCIESAASAYRLPPAVIVVLLSVEGGSLGHVSQNSNGTVDIGPMQVNTIWVPVVAKHWVATASDTYAALRDNFCANVEAGTWILRRSMDEAHGDFWEGVGFYHSHDPGYKADYLRKVLRQTLRLQAQVQRQAANTHLTSAGS
jgi:hypothetical protein